MHIDTELINECRASILYIITNHHEEASKKSPPLALLCDYRHTWAWLRLLGSGHRALLFFLITFGSGAWGRPWGRGLQSLSGWNPDLGGAVLCKVT